MTVGELLKELYKATSTDRIVYSDEYVIRVEDGCHLITTPEPEDGVFDVEMLIEAIKDYDLEHDVFVNDLLLDDADNFADFKEFDLFTEDE
jgi:hypothetical protein